MAGNCRLDAIVKSRRLINSEGLHLAEHILLRPHCQDDCSCNNYPVHHSPEINCHFPWEPGGDQDACASARHICFTPGCDPYSFIATLAMPAWPERFRSAANRTILEKMLQREAPAHVMLRILWLKPRDFCCFENYFVLWTELLAQKINRKKYSDCEFLGFLFNKRFMPLDDCLDCQPCNCSETNTQPCQGEDPACKVSVLENIEDLFGWGKDKESDFIACEPYRAEPISKRSLAKKSIRPNPLELHLAMVHPNAARPETALMTGEVEKNSIQKNLKTRSRSDQ